MSKFKELCQVLNVKHHSDIVIEGKKICALLFPAQDIELERQIKFAVKWGILNESVIIVKKIFNFKIKKSEKIPVDFYNFFSIFKYSNYALYKIVRTKRGKNVTDEHSFDDDYI